MGERVVVTGGLGFIGSNLIKGLNDQGITNILVVDDLENKYTADAFDNLSDLIISDYMDIRKFTDNFYAIKDIKTIYHQGACANTLETLPQYIMENNFETSKTLVNLSLHGNIPFIYASSAAVYGNSKDFSIAPKNEHPLNLYGYSKLLFDQYVRQLRSVDPTLPIVGLRYFNVYGNREQGKGRMMSMPNQIINQIKKSGECGLFPGGQQSRDFVFVDDIVAVNLFFGQLLSQLNVGGIFNIGTEDPVCFNHIANTVIEQLGTGKISYLPVFPEGLEARYQTYSKATGCAASLAALGYTKPFTKIEDGIKRILN